MSNVSICVKIYEPTKKRIITDIKNLSHAITPYLFIVLFSGIYIFFLNIILYFYICLFYTLLQIIKDNIYL